MVDRSRGHDEHEQYRDRSLLRDDRGQLLLVGAIAIALVLMGLVVVFNTVLYTETTAPTETLESADEAEIFNQQVRNDTRTVLFLVANDSSITQNLNGYDSMVIENMTNYSEKMGISHAHTGPVYVNVTVHDVSGTGGALSGEACPTSASATDLCANFTVVYSTQQFTYEKNNKVAVAPP